MFKTQLTQFAAKRQPVGRNAAGGDFSIAFIVLVRFGPEGRGEALTQL
jgi:hypothetical protein